MAEKHALIFVLIVVAFVIVFANFWAWEHRDSTASAFSAEPQAEAPLPSAPASKPARRGHLANKAGQSFEVVPDDQLEDWFKRHLDFKIEMIVPKSYSTIIVFSEVKTGD